MAGGTRGRLLRYSLSCAGKLATKSTKGTKKRSLFVPFVLFVANFPASLHAINNKLGAAVISRTILNPRIRKGRYIHLSIHDRRRSKFRHKTQRVAGLFVAIPEFLQRGSVECAQGATDRS